MSNDSPKSLSVRILFIVALIGLASILLSSSTLYHLTYRDELNRANTGLQQLVSTVQLSAAVAAYLGEPELAKEVGDGLMRNDIVNGVHIFSQKKVLYSSTKVVAEKGESRSFPLLSPFSKEMAGELVIAPNIGVMNRRATEHAWRYVAMMLIYTVVLLMVLLLLINWQLTRPIRDMASQLNAIEPGGTDRLSCPGAHRENEIGVLVDDTNLLLSAVEDTLQKERSLRQQMETLQARFKSIFEHASCGIALINVEGQVQTNNHAFSQIFDRRYLNSSVEDRPSLAESFIDARVFTNVVRQVKRDGQSTGLDLMIHNDDKRRDQWLHCLFSDVIDISLGPSIELIVYDISERAQKEKQARSEAERDALTKLYNRRAGLIHIQAAINLAHSQNSTCALMMIDLDRFKPINDTYGHDAGDRVLIEVADRLQFSVRRTDVVIRWGGDEFLIVLNNRHGSLDPAPVAKKIVEQIAKPYILDDGFEVSTGVSIGIAIYPDHTDNLEQLLEIADETMYKVKRDGRNGFLLAS